MSDHLLDQLLARAARFAESGAVPVRPRLAATVLLLRPAGADFEVFLLRRSAGMTFAAGMYAFPGGTVDPADLVDTVADTEASAGPADLPGPADLAGPAGGWAERLGRPPVEARAVVRAAVRELLEETGVRVEPGHLVPWTRWITPEFESRRYDTYFFVTLLPAGQVPGNRSEEADHTEWLRPAEAIARAKAGTIRMLPPTVVTLTELALHETVDEVLAAAASRDAATAILPRIETGPDGRPSLVYLPAG